MATGNTPRCIRRVIRITAEDSPNVRMARVQLAAGVTPTNEIIIPGVMPWAEYQHRLSTWDDVRRCIGLDAMFYEGVELLLIPPSWLSASSKRHLELPNVTKNRKAQAIGIDPGQGSAKTCMSVVDEHGLLELAAAYTPNTADITDMLIALWKKWNVTPEMSMFDAGGGGVQIADRLRADGHMVQTVAFGEAVQTELRRGLTPFSSRVNVREAKKAYTNRRAQMYGDVAALLDPTGGTPPFAIPASEGELIRQLSMIPKKYDRELRLKLPPKHRATTAGTETTMQDILGCSPDEADSFVVAVHCMIYGGDKRIRAGASNAGGRRRIINVHSIKQRGR